LPDDDDDDCTRDEFNLGDKFLLAQILAQSLYELHVSNWLHKAMCSDNVLYFQRAGGLGRRGTGKISVGLPFLAGYGLARTGRLSDPTQKAKNITIDLYAHPKYRDGKARYRRLYDIYSLGVVLLEVGLWRRVESGVTPEQNPEQVRSMLVDTCMAELGPAMGVVYRDVVRCCLLGDFPVDALSSDEPALDLEALSAGEVAVAEARHERTNDDLTAAFYWKVVKMLGKCYA
jgi:serine/threonine protein kinase